MEKKRDKNNKIKKVDINGKVKVIYCNPLNKRVDYVRANGHYIKLVDYKKMQKKSNKYRRGGGQHSFSDNNVTDEEFIKSIILNLEDYKYDIKKTYDQAKDIYKQFNNDYIPPTLEYVKKELIKKKDSFI